RARRGPRPRRSEERPPESTPEQWIDEGSVRDAAVAATDRAAERRPLDRATRSDPRPLDPAVGAELLDALGQQRGARLSERLAQASEALDRERFDEARRIASSIAKEAPTIAAVQEVLGLASYRLGRYKQALRALLAAQDLREDPSLLPVVADCHRALQRWDAVERTWSQIKAASPPHDVMAEGRIVMAGSLADRGDLEGAIAVMDPDRKAPKRVRDHHLREWYVIGDLFDRLGDTIAARRWFGAVAERDGQVGDVADRLRSLGR
ncbi:MAG: tetratricopeptide repeat protein, partial [Actinomycetota bacterium]